MEWMEWLDAMPLWQFSLLFLGGTCAILTVVVLIEGTYRYLEGWHD